MCEKIIILDREGITFHLTSAGFTLNDPE